MKTIKANNWKIQYSPTIDEKTKGAEFVEFTCDSNNAPVIFTEFKIAIHGEILKALCVAYPRKGVNTTEVRGIVIHNKTKRLYIADK
jgi:hypothetical protein